MEAWAFFKKPKTENGKWWLRGLYKTREKAERRLIYEEGVVTKLTGIPERDKKYLA